MNNNTHLISEEIRKYLTSSLVFTCQNCLIYKYEGSESFYDHKDVSNKTFDFIVETLSNLTDIFKYDENKKAEISANILSHKFEYSKIIFEYYIAYFNLDFIKKVYFSNRFITSLEKDLKQKVLDINKHIRENSNSVFTEFLPYLLSNITDSEFNKLASTISHEFDRFTFEQIQEIYKYDKVYFNTERLENIYIGLLNDKFAFSTIFEEDVFVAPESSEKIEKVITNIQNDVMNVISDLTLLYESLNDLNILTTFITDESILFDNQLIIKDIYFTLKTTINDETGLFVDNLFELLDKAILHITDETSDNATKILELINSNEKFDEATEQLLYILNILKTVYSDDIFDYFVSEPFFTALNQ